MPLMPPQSRGDRSRRRSFAGSPIVPRTLGPYLDNLPSPTSTIRDQRTPTGPAPNGISERSIPASPISSPSHLGRSDLLSDADGVALDDDEFQSHYSRHSSPASSSPSSAASNHSDNEENNFEPNNNGSPLHQTRSLTNPPPNFHQHNLHTSHSTTSLPPPPPIPLYPPFYNRPPTPLPPSPSLTSLLRPPSLLARSNPSTLPTTPDSSDAETPNDTEAAVAQSARRAKPLPPTSPKVPTYEYYGFAVYLGSSLTFLLYILWSYLPSPFLHALGLTYYPNRWWSLAIPAWIVMLLIFIYVALLSYNVEYLTLAMRSVECMVDEAANVATVDQHGRVLRGGSKSYVVEREKEERRRASRTTHGKKGKRKVKASGHSSARRLSNGDVISAGSTEELEGYSREWNWRAMWNEGTDAVMDVPLGGVCEVLYGEGRDRM